MRPVRVLLLTFCGPSGQVDVAIRADVALVEVLAAVGTAVGLAPGITAATLERLPLGNGVRPLSLEASLGALGLLDGDVVVLRSQLVAVDERGASLPDTFTDPVTCAS